MLEFDRVAVTLGAFRLEADTAIPAGGITALMGASGSGKSTILSLAAGFLAPDRGVVRIAGRDVTALPPGERPVSILFQEGNLFPHLTVERNVGLGVRPDLRLSAEERARRDAVLARVGLEGMGARLPRDLSGGQRSRTALARALLRHRPWLLLDEAFSALGPALRGEMLDLVRDTAAAEGVSVLLVTHDPEDARRVADRLALVAEGRLMAPVPITEAFAAPSPELRAYLGT
ncbi:ATP-binding cassette domain-containing protein [Jannaschia sp. W003]|uniref:thiamine ABC transporter ATP-binding protein n=1 Tax=Jannaschia sp. W003 TaxID=2867012 RepID=UPI0021A68315|nr:ATP-binding cassette domain-containing protein [Jannaschia sp. W003]UWQ22966.1 ATP-binding cassette domain-containing protein [Jannaschia sp. W003]